MDKDGPVGAPRWASKCTHDNEDISELLADTETLLARNRDYEDDSGQSNAESNTPKAYVVSAKVETFLKTAFGTTLNYAARYKQLAKISSPDTKWAKTSVPPLFMASILPKKNSKRRLMHL